MVLMIHHTYLGGTHQWLWEYFRKMLGVELANHLGYEEVWNSRAALSRLLPSQSGAETVMKL